MKFVEREEFRDLRDLLSSQGEAASVRWIQGKPGVGKTTLVKSLAETLRHQGWRVFSSHHIAASFTSLSQLLESLLGRLDQESEAAGRPQARVPFDERFRHALSAVAGHSPILIILDGLDEIQLDNAGMDRLTEAARIIRNSPRSHLLLSSREHQESTPLRSLACSIQPEWVFLGGLPLDAFQTLCHQLGLPFHQDRERICLLRQQVHGLPKALELVADAPEAATTALAELGEQPRVEEVYKTLYKLHLDDLLSSLPDSEKPVLQAVLGVLAILRENPYLRDLSWFVKAISPQAAPETPYDLWRFLYHAKLVKLLSLPSSVDFSHLPVVPLRLGHESFKEYLREDHFDRDNIIRFHRRLSDALQTSTTAIGQGSVLYHVFTGWEGERQGLMERLLQIRWISVLESWPDFSGSYLTDLIKIWRLLEEQQKEAVTLRIEECLNDRIQCSSGTQRLNFLETASQLALPRPDGPFIRRLADGALRTLPGDSFASTTRINELKGHLQSAQRDWRLRILLDLWPGYYPLFAVEEELNKAGIFLDIVESSDEKIRLLLEGKANLIATTPGCLLGNEDDNLDKLRVLGVLNRSCGADKILVDTTRIDLKPSGKLCGGLSDPRQLIGKRLMVAGHSTSHMFLNWFLIQNGLDLDTLDIREGSDYLNGLQKTLDDKAIVVFSIWEPYATDLLHKNPAFKVACDSREAPLIIDLLVADRDGADSLAESRELKIFGEWYDRALKEELFKNSKIKEMICQRLGVSEHTYEVGCKEVKFLNRTSMKKFFKDDAKELGAIFGEVARAWRKPTQVDAKGEITTQFKATLRGLFGEGIPPWLQAGPLSTEKPDYDVVFSFDGDEHAYPDKLFKILSQRGYKVFNYLQPECSLVGKLLSRATTELYFYRSRLCVAFYSRTYAANPFTRNELKEAKKRFRGNPDEVYLIIVRMDDSWPSGLTRNLVYISIEEKLSQIADKIQEKIEEARKAEALRSAMGP